jgi:hypothetical protein
MNTTDSKSTPASKAAELRQGLTDALTSADGGTTQTVGNLKLVQQARLSQLTRTAATLKKQYGAGDARVAAADAAVTAGAVKVARLGLVHQQLDTAPPQVSATGWALHGRVFDSTLHAVPQLTVFLVDGQKVYQQQYGFAYTDDSGYFLITHTGAAATAAGTEGNTRPDASAELYLEVVDNSSQPIFLSTIAFQPVAGSVTYQNIALASGDKPLGNPPPDIRGTAIPGKHPGA